MAIFKQINGIENIQSHVKVVYSNNEYWLYKKA